MNLLILLSSLVSCALAASDLCLVNDHFSKNFLRATLSKSGRSSVVVSAYSLLTPLSQLLLASSGRTKSELLNGIGIVPTDIECTIKKALPSVNAKLSKTIGITVKQASKIYIQEGYRLNKVFLKETKRIFGTEIEPVDFNLLSSVHKINSWVEKQTNDKITDLLNPKVAASGNVAMLVNAIYYKARWQSAFEPSQTWTNFFYISPTESVSVPYMHKSAYYMYAESEELDATLLELPYEGNAAKLLFVVPNHIDGLNNLLVHLNPTTLRTAKRKLNDTAIFLALPKFKIETETNLIETLQELGMHTLFTSAANLNELLDSHENLYVSEAKQKAFIEIDEEGTVAAVVNNIEIKLGAGLLPHNPIPFFVNRPFYFELTVGSIKLFSGVKINF